MEIEAARTLLTISNIALAVCAVIVALGTYGTFHANSIIEKYDENRQAQTDLKIAEATKASSLADARAAEANLKSAAANERASKLENETSLLKKQAEEAKAETAKVNERLHRLQKLRRLTPSQAGILSDLLKSEKFKIAPRVTFRVASVADSEAQMYAMQFQDLFHSCGVNISPTPYGGVNACTQINPVDEGLVMTVKSIDATPENQPYINFANLMDSMGLNLGIQLAPMQRDLAILNVLRKPNET